MVSLEYNKKLDLVIPFNRVEIPRHQFTFDEAVKKIIELNNLFDYDYIYLDAGAGRFTKSYLL